VGGEDTVQVPVAKVGQGFQHLVDLDEVDADGQSRLRSRAHFRRRMLVHDSHNPTIGSLARFKLASPR
jgi:hypothetical protein